MLEPRVFLSINFIGNAPVSAANLPDTALGTMGGFVPIEPFIRVNPRDPANLAPTSHIGTRISTDGGATFDATDLFPNPPGTNVFNGDTGNVFDADGRLFWVNMAGTGTRGIAVAQINPTTGAPISTRAISNSNDDKPFITADTNALSLHLNNLYVIWTRFAGTPSGFAEVYFSRSVDHGLNWSTPLQLSDATQHGFVWPTGVSVGPSGEVYVAFHANGTFGSSSGNTGRVVTTVSYDGGQTFGPWTDAISPGNADISANVQTQPGAIPGTQFWMQGAAQPWLLADRLRITNVYVVTNDDPDDVFGSGDDGEIAFSRSINGGGSWITGYLPTSAPFGTLQIFPTAAIDQFGNIVVAWYDNRRGLMNGNARYLFDVMAMYSVDGGINWSPDFMISDPLVPFDPDPGASIRFSGPPPTTRIGEYFGIDIFGGMAHVVWNGNTFSGPNPVGQQVWYSSFVIPGFLNIAGDDAGPTNDEFILQTVPTNPDWFEVLVNGQRQYAAHKSSLNGIDFAGGDGDDVLRINDVDSPTPIVGFFGGEGNDTIHVGDGSLDAMPATGVHFDGGSGFDTLLVHDQSTSPVFADTYTLNTSTLSRSRFVGLNYFNTESFTLDAGAGYNSIHLNFAPSAMSLSVDGGQGGDNIYVGASGLGNAAFGPLNLTGGTSDSTQDNIWFSALFQMPAGVTAVGGAGDWLHIGDNAGSTNPVTYNLSASTLSATFFGGLSYSGFARLEFYASTGNDTLNVNSIPTGTQVFVSGGHGSDTININETAPATSVEVYDGGYGGISANDVLNVNADGVGSAGATLAFGNPAWRYQAITIGSGGKLVMNVPDLTPTLVVDNLTIVSTGQFDLKNRTMIIDYTGASPLPSIQPLLNTGYAAGAWNGNGINSSNAAATTSQAVGFAEATDLFTTFPANFYGRQVDNTSILLAHTLYGDADLSRSVNSDDFNRLAVSFGLSGKRWCNGNFNFDAASAVNSDDFNLLATNFGLSAAAATSANRLPEDDDSADDRALQELA